MLLMLSAPAAVQQVQPPPPTPDAFAPHETGLKHDTVEIRLAPNEGMEYKYRLERGAGMVFSWSSTAPVHYELHSEPAAGPPRYAETFDRQDDRTEQHGSYVAPFPGIHGWYWENRTADEVIVTLRASGFFTESIEFRRGREPERRAIE
jgi:hypothetical protein